MANDNLQTSGQKLPQSWVYGPVPSKRLGRSLGIDLVPYKTCTYDCIYCQLGRTTTKTATRRSFPAVDAVLDQLQEALHRGPVPDYISLAGSGEPTLNRDIGEIIEGIRRMTSIPIAVLTNGSLLWQREVREALRGADVVLPSLDAGDDAMFAYVNRPHRAISFDALVSGLGEFVAEFPGRVWLEVFLLAGVTAMPAEAEKIAALCRRLKPDRVQLNTVSRPPCEDFADPVLPAHMEALKGLFPGEVEMISGRGPAPVLTSGLSERGVASEILGLLKRRPCTLKGIATGLALAPAETLKHLEGLLHNGDVVTVTLRSGTFYKVVAP